MSIGNETPFVYQNPVLPYNGSLDNIDASTMHSGLCQSSINDFYTPIQHVYVELRYLRDYVMGALFALASPMEREYIVSRLGRYNARTTDNSILTYFPELSITEDQVHAFIADPTNADALILRSPTTDLYEQLYVFFNMMTQHNQRIQAQCVTKICINFYPFEPSVLVKNFFAKLLQDINPNYLLSIMKAPLNTLPVPILLPDNKPFFQIMCIYDFIAFTSKESTVCREFLEYLLFAKTLVYAPPRVSEGIILPEEPLKRKHMFDSTEALMRICSQFTYLNPHLPQ